MNNENDSDSSADEIPLSELRKGNKTTMQLEITVGTSNNGEYSDMDDIPLSELLQKEKCVRTVQSVKCQQAENVDRESKSMETDIESDDYIDFDDSDNDPDFKPGICELWKCKEEVFAACGKCLVLLCYDHFMEDPESCGQHGGTTKKVTRKSKSEKLVLKRSSEKERQSQANNLNNYHGKRMPESFTVEGTSRVTPPEKRRRINKKKEAKQKRQSGKEYVSEKTKKVVPPRTMRKACQSKECTRAGRKCTLISEDDRGQIFLDYYRLADLQQQREFVARHIQNKEAKLKKANSRRNKSNAYFLTVNGKRVQVCKNTFLGTLGISEKFVRVILTKLTPTGIVEEDKRGGRQSEKVKERDQQAREEISNHIDRFPKVESHYCRSSSSKEYLSPDLTLPKMFHMFLETCTGEHKPSFPTNSRVFKEKNLSFHRPKKDQCSLCMSYLTGDDQKKEELKNVFEKHSAEKKKVREIKQECKTMAQADTSILCGSFDLQQVIYLPISNEDAIFYKRRLSNYNLTFYNLADHDCHCFTWHEAHSKRGSSEISTAIHMVLKEHDKNGLKKAFLFSDGCPGQNKNTIMVAMLLHLINSSSNLNEVSLRYFESFHGQSEGDSAHSAITTAIKQAGDVFVPSQLAPIFSLARRKQPYKVHTLQYDDFLDFKLLSEQLKILKIRKDNEDSGVVINWNKVMEVKVTKAHPSTIFLKTSHLDAEYNSISLKRKQANVRQFKLQALNSEPNKISKEKYGDLMSLCTGATPVVRNAEHKAFYPSLPHSE